MIGAGQSLGATWLDRMAEQVARPNGVATRGLPPAPVVGADQPHCSSPDPRAAFPMTHDVEHLILVSWTSNASIGVMTRTSAGVLISKLYQLETYDM